MHGSSYFASQFLTFFTDSLERWTSRLSDKHIWGCSDGSEELGRTLCWDPEACSIFFSTSCHELDLKAFGHWVKTLK